MSTNNDVINPKAVLMLPDGNKDFITFARGVHSAMLANPAFANATPSLTDPRHRNIDLDARHDLTEDPEDV